MKYFLTILVVLGFVIACNPTVEAPKTAGFSNIWDYDASGGIMIGSQESVNILNDYIEKHNKRDYEGIHAMNIDSIQISGPGGERIQTSDEHVAFLKTWFEQADTQWKPIWGTSVKGVNDEFGSMVLSVFDTKTTTKDTVIRTNDIIQAYISNEGKIVAFWVNSRQLTAKELADIAAAEKSGVN